MGGALGATAPPSLAEKRWPCSLAEGFAGPESQRGGGLGPLLHFQTRLRAASEGSLRGHGAGLAGSPASSQAPSLSCRCGRRGFQAASVWSVFSGESLGWSRCPVRGEAGTAKAAPPNPPTSGGPGTEFQAFPRLACATGLLPRPPFPCQAGLPHPFLSGLGAVLHSCLCSPDLALQPSSVSCSFVDHQPPSSETQVP